MKICPVCKSRCFDDMDTCYGCMYKFKDDKKTNNVNVQIDANIKNVNIDSKSKSNKPISIKRVIEDVEYFEIESYPIIEDKEIFKNYEKHENMVNMSTCTKSYIDGKYLIVSHKIPLEKLDKFLER